MSIGNIFVEGGVVVRIGAARVVGGGSFTREGGIYIYNRPHEE